MALLDQLVIRSQGHLNLYCSANSQFPINNYISTEQTNIHFNIYRGLYTTLFNQFVIQSQGRLNLYCSANSQFSINN